MLMSLLSYLEKKHFAIFSVYFFIEIWTWCSSLVGCNEQSASLHSLCSIVTGVDITQNAILVLLFCHHKIRINTLIKNNSLTNGYFKFKRPVNWMQAATSLFTWGCTAIARWRYGRLIARKKNLSYRVLSETVYQ